MLLQSQETYVKYRYLLGPTLHHERSVKCVAGVRLCFEHYEKGVTKSKKQHLAGEASRFEYYYSSRVVIGGDEEKQNKQ